MYTSRQIRYAIERYQEILSVVEFSTSHFQPQNHVDNKNGMAEALCIISDIDLAFKVLTARQRLVVSLIKQGYAPSDVSHKLNLSLATIKFHMSSAVYRIVDYLNN
jgi:DNA-binding NarL/FixJ family response regulator